jgi:hypothetical protein
MDTPFVVNGKWSNSAAFMLISGCSVGHNIQPHGQNSGISKYFTAFVLTFHGYQGTKTTTSQHPVCYQPKRRLSTK